MNNDTHKMGGQQSSTMRIRWGPPLHRYRAMVLAVGLNNRLEAPWLELLTPPPPPPPLEGRRNGVCRRPLDCGRPEPPPPLSIPPDVGSVHRHPAPTPDNPRHQYPGSFPLSHHHVPQGHKFCSPTSGSQDAPIRSYPPEEGLLGGVGSRIGGVAYGLSANRLRGAPAEDPILLPPIPLFRGFPAELGRPTTNPLFLHAGDGRGTGGGKEKA